MPKLVIHEQANAHEYVREQRFRAYQETSDAERFDQIFRLAELSLQFKNTPLKKPQAHGILLQKPTTMQVISSEAIELIKAFNTYNVKFILVGGFAVNVHGYSRATGDVDFWIEDTLQNREALISALTVFGVEGAGALKTLPLVAGYAEILLAHGIYADFMADLVTLKQNDFQRCFIAAKKILIREGISIPVLHIDDLIQEKKNSNRLKDRDDAEQLEHARLRLGDIRAQI
ncbi:MAG: hypothetical protein ACRCYO_09370 [Bacteroidia bacterium]